MEIPERKAIATQPPVDVPHEARFHRQRLVISESTQDTSGLLCIVHKPQ